MRNFKWLSGLLFACTLGAALHADEPDAQQFKWNVFLSDWQLLGPFPNEQTATAGLAIPFVENEETLRGGQVSFYKTKLYAWKPYEGGVVNFRKGLGAHGAAGTNVVGYAWTQFTSPVAQRAVLGIGYDDTMVGWLNGKEVCRGTDNWASSLDQATAEVELKAGVNTLLLKIAHGIRAWDTVARFRPLGLSNPLLVFRCQPNGDTTRLPVVDVTLLDATGTAIAQHQCSGLRKNSPNIGGYYALYARSPRTAPAKVRFRVKATGMRDIDAVFSWKQATSGNVILTLVADRPLELLVLDQTTREPIRGAEIWTKKVKSELVSSASGRVTLPDFSPMSSQCWIAANGYSARSIRLEWPRTKLQRALMTPGGQSLTGKITSKGKPLVGAKVTCDMQLAYLPTAVTDENGRFEIHSIPESQQFALPTVEHPNVTTKNQFAIRLEGTKTDVQWELAPTATFFDQLKLFRERPLKSPVEEREEPER